MRPQVANEFLDMLWEPVTAQAVCIVNCNSIVSKKNSFIHKELNNSIFFIAVSIDYRVK
jgi:hypothetical protein